MLWCERSGKWAEWFWPLFLNHLWEATLFSSIALLALILLGRAPARVRYLVWLMASLKFLLPSALIALLIPWTGILPLRSFHSLTVNSRPEHSIAARVIQVAAPITERPMPSAPAVELNHGRYDVYCLLTIVWLIGIMVSVGFWVKGHRHLVRAVNVNEHVTTGREARVFQSVKRRLSVKRDIALTLSSRLTEPGVWGIWNPIIVLPAMMSTHFNDEELESIMLHELIHINRWDNLMGSAHRALCCLLWFHPLVWFLNRKLIEEREYACDERVIQIIGERHTYVMSLWKVIRFGLSRSEAGLRCAAGSNLRRRLTRIAEGPSRLDLRPRHIIVVSGMIGALIIASMATGLVLHGRVLAQIVGTIHTPVTRTGVRVHPIATDEKPDAAQESSKRHRRVEEMMREIAGYPDLPIAFENPKDAPVRIIESSVKVVTGEEYAQLAEGNVPQRIDAEYVTFPQVTLINNTDQRVIGLTLSWTNRRKKITISMPFERRGFTIEPYGLYTFRATWPGRNMMFPGSQDDIIVSVTAVRLSDGRIWVNPKSKPARPAIPSNRRWVVVRRIQPVYPEAARREGIEGAVSVEVTIDEEGHVTSARAISGHPLLRQAAVDAARGWTFRLSNPHIPARDAYVLQFGFFSSPSLQNEWPKIEETMVDADWTVYCSPSSEGGGMAHVPGQTLHRLAIRRVMPTYPPLARRSGVVGSVSVRITIDESGRVTAAHILAGHPLLRQAALDAARQWRFRPYEVAGAPTKASGILVFYFKL